VATFGVPHFFLTMINRNIARGLFVVMLSLLFGVPAYLYYPIGDFAHGGPGLFPVVVSIMLALIGISMTIRAWFAQPDPLPLSLKNIAVITAALCAFAAVSEYVNMIVGIVLMVFIAAIAGTNYSWVRNVKISIALVLIAFAFQRLLGMNLPLY
jgi:hypothetical protein